MHSRNQKSNWVLISLSSIALHLLALSILSADTSVKPIELVYLPAVQISQLPVQKVTETSLNRRESPMSGSTKEVESALSTKNSFGILSESLYKALDENLKNRSKSLELVLALEFSVEGSLKAATISRSSGRPEVDAEVIEILTNTKLYSSSEFSNLKIQVPVRLR